MGEIAIFMPIMNMSKTTVELDADKLNNLMRAGGFKTRKEALDWALTEANKIASMNRIAETPWDAEFLKDAVDPGYNVLASRGKSVRYKVSK